MSDEQKKSPQEVFNSALAGIMAEKRQVAEAEAQQRQDAMMKRYSNTIPKQSIQEAIQSAMLSEVAPPDESLQKWTEKKKVKSAFKKRYGEKWKAVMYGHAWNMHNKRKAANESTELSDEDILQMLPEEIVTMIGEETDDE